MEPSELVALAVKAEIEAKKALLAVHEVVLKAAAHRVVTAQAEVDRLRAELAKQERR